MYFGICMGQWNKYEMEINGAQNRWLQTNNRTSISQWIPQFFFFFRFVVIVFNFVPYKFFTPVSFIHSFISLSYDRSKASSKASSPHSAIQSFLFKWGYPRFTLRSSNSLLRLLPCLPITSSPSCIFPSMTRCRRQFYPKCDQSSSPSVYVFHVGYSSVPWL